MEQVKKDTHVRWNVLEGHGGKPGKEGRKERNVLFNDTLNTFYLRLYGVGHMVKDHSESERGNPLPPHGLHLAQVGTYDGLCYTSRGTLDGTRNKPGKIPVLPWTPSDV